MIATARILYTRSTNPHHNLALEDWLLHALPESRAVLYLWQNRHTVVIGSGQNAWRECRTGLLEAEGGRLARRSSGGGAVYHDMGNLNFSFIVPRQDYDVSRQLGVVLRAVRALGIDAEASGRNDLTVDGKKFSGNAFRLIKASALHHGTLLISADQEKIARYLSVSEDKLKAKGVSSVKSRVTNLSEFADVSVAAMEKAMIDAFIEEYGRAEVEDADTLEFPGLEEKVEEFSRWGWNYGASPKGEIERVRRFNWGSLEVHLTIRGGVVTEAFIYTDAMDERLSEKIHDALLGCVLNAEALRERLEPLGRADVAQWLSEEL